DQEGYLDVYGNYRQWHFVPNSWRGFIPYDGESFFKRMKESGVALLFHSLWHLKWGIPTSRIFEALAAGCVIISDKNPFIVRELGDNVLYIDVDHTSERIGEEMFRQIHAHMTWILNHSKEAEEKARRAHAIFLEKFTLEKQMGDLIKMHEELQELK